jgi:hypothetical protein
MWKAEVDMNKILLKLILEKLVALARIGEELW